MKTRRYRRSKQRTSKTVRTSKKYGGATPKKYSPLDVHEKRKKIKKEGNYSVLVRHPPIPKEHNQGPLPKIKTPHSMSFDNFVPSGSYANDTPKIKKLIKKYEKLSKKINV